MRRAPMVRLDAARERLHRMNNEHRHQWGKVLHSHIRGRVRSYQLCTNGGCSMGRYKSGWIFVARPERRVRG